MKELWKDVLHYETSYEVSNLGNIRTKSRIVIGGHGATRFILQKDLVPTKNPDGYMVINLWSDNKFKTSRVHRLVFASFRGYYPKIVDHKDRNKTNNKETNLRDVTYHTNSHNSGNLSTNTSGVKGVSRIKATGKWYANIKHNGETLSLGQHVVFLDAVIARRDKEIELGILEETPAKEYLVALTG